MEKLLCVANWSEGRNLETIAAIQETLALSGTTVHFCSSDYDHNRIVTAFSGEPKPIRFAVERLCEEVFARIDMRHHEGVHPRIGALDVCPFVILENSMEEAQALQFVSDLAKEVSAKYQLPVYLYEKSETGKHASDLPSLRRGQFEGLFERTLAPDFGPSTAHPKLGASVFGLRDWLIAMNVNLKSQDGDEAKEIASAIRRLRRTDPRFAGVRALGFKLDSRRRSQVSMNLTRPDDTPVDPIIEWVIDAARDLGTKVESTELVGVIHRRHTKTSTLLAFVGRQIVD